ncbi:MAG: LytR/AlgR family response regulator transcription factor [Bacilli bacterium]|nr:LytTR family DNA-binding domain-containing protein [Bacilli bacterium]
MLNFIICEDQPLIRKEIINLILTIMMPCDTDYKIYEFDDFNLKLKRLINKKMPQNIFIIDIELPSGSGLDIARQIRETDWNSIIIIATAHYELAAEAVKNRLMLLDFVCKFNNFQTKLKETIITAIKIIDQKKALVVNSNRVTYKIALDEIIYIQKETIERKTVIVTTHEEHKINQPISYLLKQLDGRFIQTHRSCIVNKDYIKRIDYKNNKIIFNNNTYIYLISRSRKKDLRKNVGSYL